MFQISYIRYYMVSASMAPGIENFKTEVKMTAALNPTAKTTPRRPMPSRTVWVLEEIRRMILSGELPAGRALTEADLAQNFGVSKTPVREALKTLAGQGLVHLGDFKGEIGRASCRERGQGGGGGA